jgi:rod shape-determining protein MreC
VLPHLLVWRRRLVLLVVLGILALVVLTEQVRAPDQRRIGWLGVAAEATLAPAAAGLSRLSQVAATGWSLLREIGQLRAQNVRLVAQVAHLQEENARLRQASQENERLRKLLAFKQQLPYRTMAARVIGRDPSHWFNTILVDRGGWVGVRRNDPAMTSSGVVGHVVETTGEWARILLIVDPRSAIGVVVDRSHETGVAEGQGQPLLLVKYLSRDADIQQGDQIITAGLGQIYPRGLLVGTVVAVRRSKGELFQEALVRPAADLDHLEDVLILVSDAGTHVSR